MRELTTLEIDQLDFSGRIPDLNMPATRQTGQSTVKNPKRAYALGARRLPKIPSRKRPARIGMGRTA